MAKKLLDPAQVCSPVQQVRGGGMTKGVRSAGSGALNGCKELLHNRPGLSLIQTPPPRSEKQSWSAVRRDPPASATAYPVVQGMGGRDAVGNGALLISLA